MSHIGAIIYFTDETDSYADSIVAMLIAFPKITEIEIVFTKSRYVSVKDSEPEIAEEKEDLVYDIRNKLRELAKGYPKYRIAKDVKLIPVTLKETELKGLLKRVVVVDVSRPPKELAVNLVAASIAHTKTPVCAVQWTKKHDGENRSRIGQNQHEYNNLIELPEARRLGKYYRANRVVVYFIATSVLFLAVLSFLAYQFPRFVVVQQIMNSLAIIVGFVSLWLAIKSQKNEELFQ